MTGTLVLVVGPSGAGKDSLIRSAVNRFKGDVRFSFPRRVITRVAQTMAEDHDTLTPEMFELAVKENAFFLHWGAHDLRYGIPISARQDLSSGRCVVINVSRNVITAAAAAVNKTCVMEVTAPQEILLRRLQQRGRSDDGDLLKRVSRRVGTIPAGVRHIAIDNGGALADAEQVFCSTLEKLAA